jgi:hypothetical protein
MDLDILLPYNYKEYEWEIPAVKAFREGKEIWLVLHRRGGKDALSFSRFLLPTAFKKPGSYQYIFPTLKQGRDTFWEGKDEDGRDILDYYIPKEMIIKPDNADMKLTLRAIGGTSTIQIFGTNSGQYETLRGKPSNGVVLSEEAYQDPRALDVLKPMLLKTGGFLVHNSTPNGNNHFKAGYYYAKNNPDCFCLFKTIRDTFDHQGNPLITEADIQKERERGKTEDYIQQEYYCSFMQGVEGTYLGKQLQICRNDGRINNNIHYDENTPVYTAWDLGVADFMSIIFYQLVGNEIRIIDYYENSGYSFVHYAQMLKDKDYYYGGHYAPHDIRVREMGSNNSKEDRAISRLEKAEEVGIDFDIIPMITFESGVENSRAILGRCYFNEGKTKLLLTHLEQWGRRWNDTVQEYSDFEYKSIHSHAGAAFRYMSTVVVEETHHAGGEDIEWDRQQEEEAMSRANPYTGY